MEKQYDIFVRERITELRIKKDVSEHKMSLDLDKSGSYIRGITNGATLPSLKELFRIISYFDMTPAEFFAPTDHKETELNTIINKLHDMDNAELRKVSLFLEWISQK